MKRLTKAYLALAFVSLAWGTTYLAIQIGVQHYPAFLFAGIRQVIAGGLLLAIAFLNGKPRHLSLQYVLRQIFIGFLMITVGNGVVTWAEIIVPSGLAALICSMMPIFAALIGLAADRRERLSPMMITGMLLGFTGVGLIFRHNLADLARPGYLTGILGLLLATFGWALGSVMSKKQGPAANPLLNAGLQLGGGGICLLMISPAADTYTHIDWLNTNGLLSLVYLIIFGSVLAYTAYMYCLRELPVGIATVYAYINPLVAVLLGYWIMQEPLSWWSVMAFVAILSGVYLVNRAYRKGKTPQATVPLTPAPRQAGPAA
jgi:drug/metabolite transporter (DMT)-like permease